MSNIEKIIGILSNDKLDKQDVYDNLKNVVVTVSIDEVLDLSVKILAIIMESKNLSLEDIDSIGDFVGLLLTALSTINRKEDQDNEKVAC